MTLELQLDAMAGFAASRGCASFRGVSIINADCMAVMSKLADNAYDLAICDPPYGLGDKLKPRGGMFGNSFGGMGADSWDNAAPGADYFRELFRVSRLQIIWGGNYFLEHLHSTQCFIVWDKNNGTNPMADCELAWSNCPGVVRKFTMHHFNAGYDKKIHPTQKPVKLYKWLLMKYAQPGFRILDTHLGSGSSVIAALEHGYEMLGIEIDEHYYAAAVERIGRAAQQETFAMTQNDQALPQPPDGNGGAERKA